MIGNSLTFTTENIINLKIVGHLGKRDSTKNSTKITDIQLLNPDTVDHYQ